MYDVRIIQKLGMSFNGLKLHIYETMPQGSNRNIRKQRIPFFCTKCDSLSAYVECHKWA